MFSMLVIFATPVADVVARFTVTGEAKLAKLNVSLPPLPLMPPVTELPGYITNVSANEPPQSARRPKTDNHSRCLY